MLHENCGSYSVQPGTPQGSPSQTNSTYGPPARSNKHIRPQMQENTGSRPLSHSQACNRWISSWVGDDQRIPSAVCFAFDVSFLVIPLTTHGCARYLGQLCGRFSAAVSSNNGTQILLKSLEGGLTSQVSTVFENGLAARERSLTRVSCILAEDALDVLNAFRFVSVSVYNNSRQFSIKHPHNGGMRKAP